ncbi:phytanoyl-CoA dioxygenase family protein [Catalinimonas niigatensis]|uniref:phytanoyl-CoA dioxygenase family protein n=1 Tax=Catalinimonas niigatensis TaxID=1397264 RepID=UPI002666B71E|nr:phytanoyl-CoA dioxygenase family protein [Catalinimonas niigatensis]WPP52893.1 phytanoyl-CoA dioxygenase family protein [Catalinimonas niigatensis]
MKISISLSAIRRIKFLYLIYNIFSYSRLKYQRALYKKHGLKKRYFSSISSLDFKHNSTNDQPWLDQGDSSVLLPQKPQFHKLSEKTQSAIINWSRDGYAILRGFYSAEQVTMINDEVEKLIREKRLPVKDQRKMMFAVKYSALLNQAINQAELVRTLELLMGTPIELFQSANFLTGTQERAHSDFIHMSSYPYGYLLGVWVALEDIDRDNGPLFFYPGSHKLAYLMNADYNHGGNQWSLGKDAKQNYNEAIEKLIKQNNLQLKYFHASKGDVLIWHANMLHGGSKINDPGRTRHSMVMHYYGKDVIRYHEITQRPTLKHRFR